MIGTFFLSSVTFLLCMTILSGLTVDKYIDYNTAHDISLYNHMSRASFSPQEEQTFTPEIVSQLQALEGVETFGVTKIVSIYQYYSDEVYGDWYQIKSDFEREAGMELTDPQIWIDSPSATFWSLMIGVDSDVIVSYNRFAETPIDIDAFERGEFLLTTDMNGNGLHKADMISFSVIDTDQQFQLPIGGQIPLERDGINSGAAPWLVVSNNLRCYYPHYLKDKFIDVPDEVADALEEGRRAEHNQDCKKTYHHVYSIDCTPCIENHAMFLVLSPEDVLIHNEDEAAVERVLAHLAAAMTQLSPAQVRRLHARYALKKKFREIAADEGISGSCASASVSGAVKKLQRFFIKNGWMPKEA